MQKSRVYSKMDPRETEDFRLLTYKDIPKSNPYKNLAISNKIAFRYSLDAPIRCLAADILEKKRGNIPRTGSATIAKWIRKNIRYFLESPGSEVLQGPYTTLATMVGDCDDLAILWCTLTRSVGLKTYVAGIRESNSPYFYHAVGYDAKLDKFFELSDYGKYSNKLILPITYTLPAKCQAMFYTNEPHMAGYYLMQ